MKKIAQPDWDAYMESRYFEKHEITCEILHDPKLYAAGVKAPKMVATNTNTPSTAGAPQAPAGPHAPQAPKKPAAAQKNKADYVKELAELLEIDPAEVDPTLTIKALQEEIKRVTAEKASPGEGGSATPGAE